MSRFIQTSALTVALVAIFAVLAAISSSQPEVSAQGHANAPSGLTASILGNGIGLNWIAPSEDAASVTGYHILRRRPLQGETSLLVHVPDTGSTSRTYIDTTATEPGERYTYRVKAWRGDELSRRSNYVRVDLPESEPDPTPTPAPVPERSHVQEEPEEDQKMTARVVMCRLVTPLILLLRMEV